MERNKVSRLNVLFEKMVQNRASQSERDELRQLYEEYIEDGREGFYSGRTPKNTSSITPFKTF